MIDDTVKLGRVNQTIYEINDLITSLSLYCKTLYNDDTITNLISLIDSEVGLIYNLANEDIWDEQSYFF